MADGKERAAGAKPAAGRAAQAAQAERRKPGRPPSKPPAPPLVQRGIVDSPEDSNNRLELVHGDPMIFKALFTYLKNIRAREVHVRCSPDGLTFFARDHTKTSRVVAKIAGQHVNWCYVEETFWVGLNRDTVEKMFAAIDKTFYKITIVQTHDDPDALVFVFKDPELDKECNYKVTLSKYDRDPELYEAEEVTNPATLETTFPIEFALTAKQFKKTISDASAYSETIAIEKIGAHPLQLTYNRATIKYNEVYRNPEKIKLRSSISEGASFRCTVKIANIKSLASSMVTDDARILCREEKDILLRSAIDAKALVVSTLTRLA